MGIAGFLNQPQHDNRSFKIISWNIGGCKTKKKKKNVEKFLLQYDIVALNEVKMSLPVCLLGYVFYMSYDRNCSHRGGTTVLLRNVLSQGVIYVDTSAPDQVVSIENCLGHVISHLVTLLIFLIENSPLSKERLVGNVTDNRYLIIGDLNAQLGRVVREINDDEAYSCPYIPDDITTPNDNAYVLTTICKD